MRKKGIPRAATPSPERLVALVAHADVDVMGRGAAKRNANAVCDVGKHHEDRWAQTRAPLVAGSDISAICSNGEGKHKHVLIPPFRWVQEMFSSIYDTGQMHLPTAGLIADAIIDHGRLNGIPKAARQPPDRLVVPVVDAGVDVKGKEAAEQKANAEL